MRYGQAIRVPGFDIARFWFTGPGTADAVIVAVKGDRGQLELFPRFVSAAYIDSTSDNAGFSMPDWAHKGKVSRDWTSKHKGA